MILYIGLDSFIFLSIHRMHALSRKQMMCFFFGGSRPIFPLGRKERGLLLLVPTKQIHSSVHFIVVSAGMKSNFLSGQSQKWRDFLAKGSAKMEGLFSLSFSKGSQF